jgi:hypothetical protein
MQLRKLSLLRQRLLLNQEPRSIDRGFFLIDEMCRLCIRDIRKVNDICTIVFDNRPMEHSEDGESKTEYFSTTEYSGGDMYGYTNAPPPPPREQSKRPGIITFICVLGFLAGLTGILVSLLMSHAGLPEWYRPFSLLSVVVSIAGYIGIWNMKKWGLYLLCIMFTVGVIVAYTTQIYSVPAMTVSAIILLIIVFNSGKMD